MKKRVWQIGLLSALILALLAPTALAQDIGGDRLVIGQSFVLKAGEELNGSLAVMGGSVTVQADSAVRGDITVLGGALTVAGTVEGNVAIFGGSATLQETAVVNGNVAAFGGSIRRDPGAIVTGDVFSSAPGPLRLPLLLPLPGIPDLPELVNPGRGIRGDGALGVLGAILLWQLVTVGWALGLALLGAIAVSVAPRAMGRMASQAARDTFVSFAMGLLTLVVGVLASSLLLIACCIGLLGWLALGIAWLVGWLAVGLWLGQRMLQALNVRNATAIGEVALGVAVITILARLPWCIGFLFGVVIGCVGLGAVVLARFGLSPSDEGRAPAGEADETPVVPDQISAPEDDRPAA